MRYAARLRGKSETSIAFFYTRYPADTEQVNKPWFAILSIIVFASGAPKARAALPNVGQTRLDVAICPQDFAGLVKTRFGRIPPVLKDLEKAIQDQNLAQQDQNLWHAMTIIDGKAYVEVGYMSSKDPVFLNRLADAVRAGAVAKIDVGFIVGPKVLNWITRIADLAPQNHSMGVTGYFKMSHLIHKRDVQMLDEKLARGEGREIHAALSWDQTQRDRFERSIKRLGLEKACKILWKTDDLKKCHNLRFHLMSSKIDDIVWERDAQ